MSKAAFSPPPFDPAVESVEVKITVRPDEEDAAERALDLDADTAERREVYFFDTRDLSLFDAGVVLRARKCTGDDDDSTVKLRPVVPSELPERWSRIEGFKVEVDVVGEGMVCSASLSAVQRRDEIDEAAGGRRTLKALFSEEQERFLADYGPAEIGWEELGVLGPVEVRRWKVEPKGLDYEVTAEAWRLPDGSDLLELSVKTEPPDAGNAYVAFADFLRSRDLSTEGDQQIKTRTALTYFTEEAAA